MSGKIGSITTDIVADGLVFNMDAANRASYVEFNTTSFNTINTINISKGDLKNRDDYQKARTNFKYNREKGYLNKYRHLVTPASLGCYIN